MFQLLGAGLGPMFSIVGWLAGRLAGRLLGWLAGCLTSWLAGWLADLAAPSAKGVPEKRICFKMFWCSYLVELRTMPLWPNFLRSTIRHSKNLAPKIIVDLYIAAQSVQVIVRTQPFTLIGVPCHSHNVFANQIFLLEWVSCQGSIFIRAFVHDQDSTQKEMNLQLGVGGLKKPWSFRSKMHSSLGVQWTVMWTVV